MDTLIVVLIWIVIIVVGSIARSMQNSNQQEEDWEFEDWEEDTSDAERRRREAEEQRRKEQEYEQARQHAERMQRERQQQPQPQQQSYQRDYSYEEHRTAEKGRSAFEEFEKEEAAPRSNIDSGRGSAREQVEALLRKQQAFEQQASEARQGRPEGMGEAVGEALDVASRALSAVTQSPALSTMVAGAPKPKRMRVQMRRHKDLRRAVAEREILNRPRCYDM